MVRVLLARAALLFVVLAAPLTAQAKPAPSIELILETQEAFLGDAVVVEVRWSGLVDDPDLTPLFRDATLLRETAGTRLAVIEGQVVDIASRRLELQPRALGLLTLGPIENDGVTSNSVSIKIEEPQTLAWTPGPDDVQLSQNVSTTEPWLQQQVLVKVQLRTRYPMAGEVVTLPVFDGLRALPTMTARRTLDEKEGWALTEWRWLVFPQRSGALGIPGAAIKGGLIKSRAERGDFNLKAPDMTLAVRPAAFDAGQWWIAAKSLKLTEQWSKPELALTAGDEVERTLIVTATGVLPEQIPNLSMAETRGLQITPLDVQRESRIVGDEAQAVARFRIRLRVLSPGSLFVDTVRLRWWNTEENRAADAILPARRIETTIPDRDILAAQALAEQGVFDRLGAALGAFVWPIYAGVILLAVAAALALSPTLRPALQRRLALSSARRKLARLARDGDAAGLHQALRQLARSEPGATSAIGHARLRLEELLFGGGKMDRAALAAIAAEAATGLCAGGDSPQHLPPL